MTSPAPRSRNWARAERSALCDLLTELGPDAPTLCEGWTTGDLSAHLLIRERRPDAGPGLLLPPLAGYTERLRRQAKENTPYAQRIERIRNGPPRWSPWSIMGVDAAANLIEYFVHHEDVRRAQEEWEPRTLDPGQEEQLWRRLRMTGLVLRRVPLEITLVRPDQAAMRVTKGGKQVRVHGPVGELVLWGVGRKDVARVRLTGEAEAIDILSEKRWRL